eukprot:TRINITY_DN3743_c0_g1_i1.p2 TRINITY_DN3743_c0_g1~~TRINITY_DN3743_c0_g1_i1.p2  ORF type:complete len:206 (-),score=113.93 TRINITY_DN3743_c0_g1_i1:2-619(-)
MEAVVKAARQFIADACESGDASIDAFRAMCRPIIEPIRASMFAAGEIQVEAMTRQMIEWREMCSEEEWRELYALVLTIWPVAVDSPREVCLRLAMDPTTVEQRLLIADGVSNVPDALTMLGRVVADRHVARLVFNDFEENAVTRSLVHSLSSPRDVVADASYAAVEKILRRESADATLADKLGPVEERNLQNPRTFSGPMKHIRP